MHKKYRKIIHIDMDCFYAAIEMRDNPDLVNKSIAVGGDPSRRGVIATCNYKAREFGIHSAMATGQALKLCPDLIVVPTRMDVYKQESAYIREIFAKFTHLIEPLSLDEAFLDVTESHQFQGSATLIAQEIRKQIFNARQLTASAGISINKCIAKIASDWNKPNGQTVIRPENIDEFMKNLPVRKLFGVGPKMEEKLLQLGIKSCQQLQMLPRDELLEKFGSMGDRLYELSRGKDDREVNPDRIRKSVSVETTYPVDLVNLQACIDEMPELLQRLSQRIANLDKQPSFHSLFVKMKFTNFQQTTVETTTSKLDIKTIEQLVSEGWHRVALPVRLLGVGVKLCQENQNGITQLTIDY